jgi:hypothetical protein
MLLLRVLGDVNEERIREIPAADAGWRLPSPRIDKVGTSIEQMEAKIFLLVVVVFVVVVVVSTRQTCTRAATSPVDQARDRKPPCSQH